jgi:hypothetical protein
MSCLVRSCKSYCLPAILLALSVVLSPLQSAFAEELTGTMSVFVIDSLDGSSLKQHRLLLQDGSQVKLDLSNFSKVSSHITTTGAGVRANGEYSSATEFRVDEIFLESAVPPMASDGIVGGSVVSGTRRPVIILVNIGSNTPFCTAEEIDETMYTGTQSANGLFEASSRNQLTFDRDVDGNGSADIFGPYTISASSGSCDNYHGWGQAALSEAETAGVDFSPYQHRIFVLPRICAGVGGSGGQTCGDQCTTYIHDCHREIVWNHELGHNLGMDHSGTDPNNDGVIKDIDEYGDTSCPMGFSALYPKELFNAPNTVKMGWLDAFTGKVSTVSTNRNMNVASLESDSASGTDPQIVKIQKSAGEYYYLSFRTAAGTYDEILNPYKNKLNIHTAADSSRRTRFVEALDVGESFTDSTLGLTVCHNSYNSGSMNMSVVFGSYSCDGVGDPGGSSGGAVPGDSDGDGTTDAQEIADGTNASDPGSYMERLVSPVYILWNSFLGMTNIIELVNPSSSSSTSNVTVSLYSIDGNHVYSQQLALAVGQQYDLILNDFPGFLSNSYGIVKVTYSGELDGRMSYYRPSGSSYEFAYSVPLATALRGTTGVSFNTFQPSENGAELNYRVNNWLTVVNLSSSTEQFQVKSYNQAGTLLADQTLTIPAFGRSDIDGGHQLVGPSVVGFHEIIPLDQDEPYISQLTRYGTNAEGSQSETAYFFAFPLAAHAGNGEVMYLPISRQFGETNWVEVINTKNTAVNVSLDFYNSTGTVTTVNSTLQPHAQLNYLAREDYLNPGERGFVRITPNTANSIIAQSMYYYKDTWGGIDAVSGIQPREALGATYSGSYNLFLGMQNWATISNLLNQEVVVTVNTVGPTTTGSTAVTLDPYSSTSIPVHSTSSLNVSADTYGSIAANPDTIRSLIVDLFRVRYEGSELDFAFPTAVRGR